MTGQDKDRILILPPSEPLVTLSPREFCDALGVAKTTVFRWEERGLIGPVRRDYRTEGEGRYTPEHILEALELMRGMTNGAGFHVHPWASELDLDQRPLELNLQNGYKMRINRE